MFVWQVKKKQNKKTHIVSLFFLLIHSLQASATLIYNVIEFGSFSRSKKQKKKTGRREGNAQTTVKQKKILRQESTINFRLQASNLLCQGHFFWVPRNFSQEQLHIDIAKKIIKKTHPLVVVLGARSNIQTEKQPPFRERKRVFSYCS